MITWVDHIGSVSIIRFSETGDWSSYDKGIVVEHKEDGRVLHLHLWLGTPLAKSDWIEAGKLFPKAEVVKFLRWKKNKQAWVEVETEIPKKDNDEQISND